MTVSVVSVSLALRDGGGGANKLSPFPLDPHPTAVGGRRGRFGNIQIRHSREAARVGSEGRKAWNKIIQIPSGDRALALVGVLGGLFSKVPAQRAGTDAVMKAGDNATVVESELDDLDPGLTPFATCSGPVGAEFGLGYLRTEPGRRA